MKNAREAMPSAAPGLPLIDPRHGMTAEEFHAVCEEFEHWETDPWTVPAVLSKEILTRRVVDPCTGTGIMAAGARAAGYEVLACDLRDWGYDCFINDWLAAESYVREYVKDETVFMNPPFSLSEDFVDRALEYGARKIVCFQRLGWREGSRELGARRGQWWDRNPPARIWLCGDRAHCHLHSAPEEKRTGRSIAYAYFVWERGHAPAATLGAIYRGDGG